jgi:predicted nuclease of predicted toxin-antitoxin system
MPIYIGTLLREQGYDVFDPRMIGMRGMDDESLLEIAASEGQIIITRDLDFNLMLVKNLKPAGVILVRYPEILSPQTVTRLFRAFIAVGGLEHTQGMIAVLRPGRIRFRPLGPWAAA